MDAPLSIYIHIPFCIKRSRGDAPNVCEAGSGVRRDYLKALEREIEAGLELVENRPVSSIFVGGGGSMLLPDEFARLLLKLKRAARPVRGMELTIRFVPETLQSATLSGLNICSFNRVSVEALCQREKDFRFLGTSYGYATVEDGMNMLSLFKYPNCDVELLYGIPGQSEKAFENALCSYTNFRNVTHVTLRPYAGNDAVADAELGERFAFAAAYLGERGFRLYADGRFAKPGRECQFALDEAHDVERLGFGAAARTVMDGYSYENTADVARYIEGSASFEKIAVNPVRLDEGSTLCRRAALRLQLNEGFDYVEAGFAMLGAKFERLAEMGLVELESPTVRPTLLALRAPERVRAVLCCSCCERDGI